MASKKRPRHNHAPPAGAPATPVNAVLPAITGTTTETFTLTCDGGSWTPPPTTTTYQWQRCDADGTNCSNIGGATNATYVLVHADVGHTIKCVVTAANVSGSAQATSAATAVVIGPVIYWGAYLDKSPYTYLYGGTYDGTHAWQPHIFSANNVGDNWDTFEAHCGKTISLISFGFGFRSGANFPTTHVNNAWNRGAIPCWNIRWGDPNVTNANVVSTAGTTNFTRTAHGYLNGMVLKFTSTAPGGFTKNTAYYVVNKATDTFQLSATSGGAAITPTTSGSWVNEANFTNARIAAGDNDAKWNTFLTQAVAINKPIMVLLCVEMNGSWEPESGVNSATGLTGVAGNTPANFITAWQHIWGLAQNAAVAAGAASGTGNLTFCWIPNAINPNSLSTYDDIEDYYPGDAYVDWTGYDTFSYSYPSSAPNYNPGYTAVIQPTYDKIVADVSATKPMIITQTNVNGSGSLRFPCADKPGMVATMFTALPNFPLIKGVITFNWHLTGGTDLAEIEDPCSASLPIPLANKSDISAMPSAIAFRAGITDPYYRSKFTTIPTGLIKVPDPQP